MNFIFRYLYSLLIFFPLHQMISSICSYSFCFGDVQFLKANLDFRKYVRRYVLKKKDFSWFLLFAYSCFLSLSVSFNFHQVRFIFPLDAVKNVLFSLHVINFHAIYLCSRTERRKKGSAICNVYKKNCFGEISLLTSGKKTTILYSCIHSNEDLI